MKFIIMFCFLSFSLSGRAAMTRCYYTQEPCDQFGNHYMCATFGWTGPSVLQFCAPAPQNQPPPTNEDESGIDQSICDQYLQQHNYLAYSHCMVSHGW